jgi:hypothetical protein
MTRKTLAAALVILGAALLTFTAAVIEPLAGVALAGVFLIALAACSGLMSSGEPFPHPDNDPAGGRGAR